MSRYIFRDRRGIEWITSEGVLRYFGIRIVSARRYFYRYSDFL